MYSDFKQFLMTKYQGGSSKTLESCARASRHNNRQKKRKSNESVQERLEEQERRTQIDASKKKAKQIKIQKKKIRLEKEKLNTKIQNLYLSCTAKKEQAKIQIERLKNYENRLQRLKESMRMLNEMENDVCCGADNNQLSDEEENEVLELSPTQLKSLNKRIYCVCAIIFEFWKLLKAYIHQL